MNIGIQTSLEKVRKLDDVRDFEKLELGEKVNFRDGYVEGIYAGKVSLSLGLPGEKTEYLPLFLNFGDEYVVSGVCMEIKNLLYLHHFSIKNFESPKRFNMYKSILEASKE